MHTNVRGPFLVVELDATKTHAVLQTGETKYKPSRRFVRHTSHLVLFSAVNGYVSRGGKQETCESLYFGMICVLSLCGSLLRHMGRYSLDSEGRLKVPRRVRTNKFRSFEFPKSLVLNNGQF